MKHPRKIFILGIQGSGKTTLAAKLGEQLKIAVYYTDAVRYDSDWKIRPMEKIESEYNQIVTKDSWIIDGCPFWDGRFVGPTADLCIYVTSGRFRSYFNIIKRKMTCTFKDRVGVPKGSNTKIYFSFLKKVWKRNRKREADRKRTMQEKYPSLEFIIMKKINKKSISAVIKQLNTKNHT